MFLFQYDSFLPLPPICYILPESWCLKTRYCSLFQLLNVAWLICCLIAYKLFIGSGLFSFPEHFLGQIACVKFTNFPFVNQGITLVGFPSNIVYVFAQFCISTSDFLYVLICIRAEIFFLNPMISMFLHSKFCWDEFLLKSV